MKLGRDSALAVRGDRRRVREVLETAGSPAALGPERDGWQPVRLPPSIDPGPLAVALATASGTAVLGAEVDHERAALTITAWWNGAEQARLDGGPGSSGAAAGVAAAFGRPHLAEQLAQAALDPTRSATDRAAAAAAALGLPDGILTDREPARSVALYRGDPHDAEMTAAAVGGACLAVVDGWWLGVPAGPDVSTAGLAAGLSTTRGRRDRALWLWQDGDDGGYIVWQGGRPLDTHAWAPGWEVLAGRVRVDDAPQPAVGDAAVLAASLGRSDVTVPLRALLRRRDPAPALLPELAALLDLPSAVPDVLAGRTEVAALPGARWRESASVSAIASEQERRRAENQSSARRWAWFLLAALAAVSGAVLTVTELVIMAVSGVGDGAWNGDPLSAARFAGFTALMTWYAVRRFRRVRR